MVGPDDIIYEDEQLLALNKPALLHSATLAREGGPAVADFLESYLPASEQIALKPEDHGLVNRLDYETSGCLIAAKNRTAWEQLHHVLCSASCHKEYLAISHGIPPSDRNLEALLESRYRRSKKVRIVQGKDAATRAQLAKTKLEVIDQDKTRDIALVKLSPCTGVRHQLRVLMANGGYPLIGDKLYGSNIGLNSIAPDCPEHFVLHAYRYQLNLPTYGDVLRLCAPYPEYLRQLFPNSISAL